MGLLDKFFKREAPVQPQVQPAPSESPAAPAVARSAGRGIGDSEDLRRILAIPRRTLSGAAAKAAHWKARLGLGDVPCECRPKYSRQCCADLRPIQALALSDASTQGGLLGAVGVGHGKSLLDLLTPMAVDGCKVAVLLVPPNLKSKMLELDVPFYGQHWKLPNIAGGRWLYPDRPTLHVVSFAELSSPKHSKGPNARPLLEKLNPDTIIIDEAHFLRYRTAARTKRFLAYLRKHPWVRVYAWSGTLTARSIKDWGHLSEATLGNASPLPRSYPVLDEWSACIDGDPLYPVDPGDLQRLCAAGESVRDGFLRRFVDTAGVISSGDAQGCEASLEIVERKFTAPSIVEQHIANTMDKWERPDGDPFTEAFQLAACARQLSCGFFYRWRYPRKESRALIDEWFQTRRAYFGEVRKKLALSIPHMDSPLLLSNAAQRWQYGYTHIMPDNTRTTIPPKVRRGPQPTWESEHWLEWQRIKDKVQPEQEAVWFDTSFLRNAAAWLTEGPGVAWYEYDTVGVHLSRLANDFIHVAPGTDGNAIANSLKGTERAVASIRAHGTGKDLQMFDRALILNPPSSGAAWEQLLGRHHRAGQQSDEVVVSVYRHTEALRDAVETARKLSGYIQATIGNTQKLVSCATYGW